jgi:serine/threonine-protein kinase
VAAILIGCVVIYVIGMALNIFPSLSNPFSSDDDGDEEVEVEIEWIYMIDVIGMEEEQAKKALIALGLVPEIETVESTEADKGKVIDSSYREGERVNLGSNVVLTISIGAEGVTVPNLINKTAEEAIATLTREGFTYSRIDDYDEFIAVGNVFRQSPEANSVVEKGAMITLSISLGPEEKRIAVPNLVGKTEMDAMATLAEMGLVFGGATATTHENAALAGLICSQSIAEGVYVESGTTITVQVSTGVPGALYSFIGNIHAPTYDEDPDYHSGTSIHVILVADDGTELHNHETVDFPYPVTITNIKSPYGTLTLQYVNITPAYTINHDDGTVEEVEEEFVPKVISRSVEFIEQ